MRIGGAVVSEYTMNRTRWFLLAMLLGFATLLPSRASAQVDLPQTQCVGYFLSACATLHFIDFSNTAGPAGKGVLTLIVSNTSNAAVEPNAYIKMLLFDVTGTMPEVQNLAVAQYGYMDGQVFTATPGDTEKWNVKRTSKIVNGIDGVEFDLSLDDKTKEKDGGIKSRVPGVGDAVMITIGFDEAFEAGLGLGCDNHMECQSWTAEMKGLGEDLEGKGYTTTPEPSAIILLASGLVGLAGAGAVRRWRRSDPDE